MRTYEVTVKVPAYYGREGSGKYMTTKIQAGSRALAAARGVKAFMRENDTKDLVSRTMTVQIARVA